MSEKEYIKYINMSKNVKVQLIAPDGKKSYLKVKQYLIPVLVKVIIDDGRNFVEVIDGELEYSIRGQQPNIQNCLDSEFFRLVF